MGHVPSTQHLVRVPLHVTLVLVACVLLWPARLDAQAVYGSIGGTVTDESGAVLPGVTITITSVERNTTDVVVSNESGFFLKDRLVPGNYQVKAELTGFKQAVVPNVPVNVDRNTPVPLKLDVGAVSEQVQVVAETVLLRTDRADVATVIESKMITDLPVLDRNFTKFLLLTPGTQQMGWQHAASENPQGSTQTQVNGQHFSGTAYQLDGTENRDPILGIIVINPPLESIAESKITSQNYDAEFGQATAGIVSVQTRSGGNDFHGSVFEFFQNDRFQARNPFSQFAPDPITGRFLPKTKKNQYGGSFGGPIERNRLFFFGDYEGTRSDIGGSRLETVPTLAARNGDFSAYGVNIFDPLTGLPFPGNVIPASRLSQQALNLLRSVPLPSIQGDAGGTINNFVGAGSETFNADAFDVRIDGRVHDGFNMFGRYSLGNFKRNGPQVFGTGGGQQVVGLGGLSNARNQSLAYGIDRALSPSLFADFRFGFFRYHVNVLPSDFGTTPATAAGIPGLNLDSGFSSGLPAIFVGEDSDARRFAMGTGLGERVGRCNCPLDEDEKQFQLVGNVTKVFGTHSAKVGVDVRRAYNLRVPSDNHRSGELTFRNERTASPTTGQGGLALASFMLGDVYRIVRYASPTFDARERQWRHFYYGQDTWRVTPKFTANYGLRLDVINPQSVNAAGNGGFVDLNTGLVNVAGEGSVPLNGGIKNRLNWAPRLGATYELGDRTVIRAGYGRSYDIGVFGSLFGHTVTQNLPVLAIQDVSAPSFFGDVFNLAQGAPIPVFPTVPASGQFPLPNGVRPRVLPSKQRPPAVDAFNVMVQHQLSGSMSIEAGYVGNRGTRVFAGDNPDLNINQPTIIGFGTVSRDQRKPFFNLYGWTQDVTFYCNCATNKYDSLQARFVKRYSAGYSFQANYTLQRTVQSLGEYFQPPVVEPVMSNLQGLYDTSINTGPADWDRKHSFAFAAVAELPIGRERRYMSNISPALDALIGGWQVNANTFIYSGLPFNVTYRDGGADRDTGPNRPNVIGDPSGPKTVDQWFNALPIGAPGSAFARPAPGTFGNYRRNSLRGPGYWRTDASIFKHFRFTNSQDLELRAEAVNIFNTVNLANPDSEIGVPGNTNPNAGKITSTAFGGLDPQRNFQFAVKWRF